MISPRAERKLGSAILRTAADIQLLPRDQIKAFMVLQRRLKRQVAHYEAATGKSFLAGSIESYGFETSHHGQPGTKV